MKNNEFGDGKMNGFAMMSDSYKILMEHGKLAREIAEREIKVYDFLATCTVDDFCRMVDSTAFNDIIRAYVKMSVVNAELEEEQQERILNQLRWIFDEKSAKEVLKSY